MNEEQYRALVGKTVRGVEGGEAFLRESRWRVAEFEPSFDFGSRGGKKPAYWVERLNEDGEIHPDCPRAVQRADTFSQVWEVVLSDSGTAGRPAVGDTAGWQPALPPGGAA